MSETLVSSTAAGLFASIIESYVTYPLEYLKVREQIAIRPHGSKPFQIPNFTSVFYKGSSAFVLGNALKTCVRFNVYNHTLKFVTDSPNKTRATGPQVMLAGMLTGIAETLVVVPFESIKTTMIEASALGKGYANGALPVPGSQGTQAYISPAAEAHLARQSPQNSQPAAHHTGSKKNGSKIRPAAPKNQAKFAFYEVKELGGMTSAIRQMYAERGLRAFVQGFNPTVLRQVANSGLRFMGYNVLRQLAAPNQDSLSMGMIIALTGISGLAEALFTQPIDVIKSRMQTTNGLKLYGNSLLCAYRIISEEGWTRMWAGLVPRALRIWLSGGLTFIVYEEANKRLKGMMREDPFSWKSE